MRRFRKTLREDSLTISTPPPGIAAANDPTPPAFGAFAPNAAQAAIISLAQRSRLKRGAFRPMLSRLVNLLRAGPVDVQYQGASFRFYHQVSATERGALFNPDYNLEELDFLRAHTPQGGVFVDVGANVGTYAMVMARHVGAGGTVIAIEPHPVTHARLAFNRAASGYTQVTLVAAAAGLPRSHRSRRLMEREAARAELLAGAREPRSETRLLEPGDSLSRFALDTVLPRRGGGHGWPLAC